ncbi:hypothetical protein K491DRAFT_714879 [Lophiostoma macrostomum CBS 122681]|uniref:Rhodopsin domain-containing protein n=1 Tax=Lophiostoma macrostomum CBS 122681 TaxID=1314788 RepID=A0A6A6TBH4_9PLEO|nr:hypothetical protein K491DRAFT_714879 [Lophiostoma macrostomum CBS 122681]
MSVLQPEACIWYTICSFVVSARLISKRLTLGAWWRLQLDDYLVILAMITLTGLIAVIHTVEDTNSNLIAPGTDITTWSSEEFQRRVYGSKLRVVAEQLQISCIWLLKASVLIMYSRMTALLRLRIVVTIAGVYIIFSFVIMEVLWFFVWCRPFQQYWAVPANSIQCSVMPNHLRTNVVLNVSSDLILTIIPFPLVAKVQIPLKNRLILGAMFSLGFLTIACAIVSKYQSYNNPYRQRWMIWHRREAFTVMLGANLPLTRPVLQRLFRHEFWAHMNISGEPSSTASQSHLRPPHDYGTGAPIGISTTVTGGLPLLRPPRPPRLQRASPYSISEEYINQRTTPLEILYMTEVSVERSPAAQQITKGDGQECKIAVEETDHSREGRPTSLVTACYHEPREEA